MPEVYWIRDVEPLRLAIMPRPRGGEWLADEVSGWKRLGIDVVISLLHRYEADELDISDEESLCRDHEIYFRSFPIRDRGTPDSVAEFLALQARSRRRSNRASRSPSTAVPASAGRVC
jgi:hypothetical protein